MERMSRKRLFVYGLAGGSALVLPARQPRVALARAPRRLRRFVEPLPVPGEGIVVARPAADDSYALTLREITRQLHPDLPATPIWAYDDGTGLHGQSGSFGIVIPAEHG